MEWKKIMTESDINEFMNLFDNFHDSCIKEISYSSGTYVDDDFSMIMNVEPTAKIVIQRQSEFMTSIEFLLEGVTKLHINNDLHATLEIFKAKFFKKNDLFYWFENDDDENSTNFVCETIRWRII